MQILIICCSIISIIISSIAIILGCISISIVVGLKNSTHRIEWKAVEDPFKNKVEDLEEFADDGINDL